MSQKATRNSVGAEVWSLALPTRAEHFITVCGDDGLEMDRALRAAAKERSASIVDRFVFAGVEHYDSFLRSAPPPESRLTWLQGDACHDGEVSSMQAFAISGAELSPIMSVGRCVGYVYEDAHARYCRLCGVPPSDLSASRSDQTREVFETMSSLLKSQGFVFADTVRTWFYLDGLLSWYKEFNTVRTKFFEEEGVFSRLVPASTGIGARNQHGAALVCGLLAVQPKSSKVKIQAVDSPLQGSAMSYRSSFSRAVEMSFPTHRSLFISGTASIDKEGRSIYLGDTARQIDMTMRVVEALLESRGMGWDDVSRGIAYFKDMGERDLLGSYCESKGIPSLPLAPAHTDICRDDLLFEVEIDAVKAVS